MTKYLFFFLSIFLSSALGETFSIAPVKITAKRLYAGPETLASTKTILTQRTLQKFQEPNLVEALRDVPGVSVVQSGGKGHLTAVFMRGLNPNHLQVRVDGFKSDDPTHATGAFDFSYFSSEGLQTIEIERGAVGSLYGSDAIAGVIHMRTAKGEGKMRAQGRLEGGSYRSYRMNGGLQGECGVVNLNFWLSEQYTRGIITNPKRLRLPEITYYPDPFRQKQLNGRMGVTINDQLSVSFFTRSIHKNLGYLRFGEPWRDHSTQAHNRLQVDFQGLGGHWIHEWAVSHLDVHHKDKALDGSVVCYLTGKRTQLSWYQVLKEAPCHQTRLLLDYLHDFLKNPQAEKRKTATLSELGCGLHHRWEASSKVAFEVGGRYGQTSGKFRIPATYRAAMELNPLERLKIQASYGTGVKLPTLYRLYIDQFGFKANPHLKPEHSQGWDLGISREFTGVTVGATYFSTHLRDMIETDYVLKKAINVHRAHSRGVELYGQVRPCEELLLRLDYTHLRATGDKGALLRRPRHKMTVLVDYQATEKLNINADVTYTGARPDIGQQSPRGAFSRVRNGSFVTGALRAAYGLRPGVQIYARIENILNRKYENPYGYGQLKRGIYAGVVVKR